MAYTGAGKTDDAESVRICFFEHTSYAHLMRSLSPVWRIVPPTATLKANAQMKHRKTPVIQVSFAKQQGEIAALNRAQEKAEARVSSIHHQLIASESELSVLEGEMAEVRAARIFVPTLYLTIITNMI